MKSRKTHGATAVAEKYALFSVVLFLQYPKTKETTKKEEDHV
jgi:hypothetical protein